MNQKKCHGCNQILDLTEYGKDKYRGDGLTTRCRKCRNMAGCIWRLNNIDKVKEKNDRNKGARKEYYARPENKRRLRENHLKRKLNMNHEKYEEILKTQNGVCAICGKFKTAINKDHMAVDHCHTTGKIRGILCNPCNTGLGSFRDDPELLKKAATYLEKHTEEKDKNS